MLLLQRRGPAAFIVKDSSGMKNTVQIGSPHSCTCQRKQRPQGPQLCAHIMFVLVKVLQIDPTSPLVRQTSFTGVTPKYNWCVSSRADKAQRTVPRGRSNETSTCR